MAFVGAVAFYLTKNETVTSETYAGTIQERLQKEVLRVNEDMDQIMGRLPLPDGKPFSELLLETPYPYYLYRDSTLLVWSDYRYVVNYALFSGASSEIRPIETPQGKFLQLSQRREIGGNLYDLFVLLELQSHFQAEQDETASGFNSRIFDVAPQSLSLTGDEGYLPVNDQTGRPFFYVNPPNGWTGPRGRIPVQSFLLAFLALLFLIAYLGRVVRQLGTRHRYGLGLAVIVLFVVIIRGLMLHFSIPSAFYDSAIFDAQNYEGSPLSPSLGDLLLNGMGMLWILVYANRNYFRTVTYRRLVTSPPVFQYLVSLLILLVSYMAYYLCYRELVAIYGSRLYTLDITLSITFSPLKITALAVFVCLSGLYFMITQLVFIVYIRLTRDPRVGGAILLLSVGLVYAVSWLIGVYFKWIFLTHVAYILTLYLTRLPRTFYGFRYPTTVYYFLTALVCALTGTYVVESQENTKDVLNKKEFGQQLLTGNDPLAEFLLKKDIQLVAQDREVQQFLVNNVPLAREMIQQRIRSQYLDRYLDEYTVEVLTFDRQGNPLDNSAQARSHDYYLNTFGKPAFATPYPGVFMIDMPGLDTSAASTSGVGVPLPDNAVRDTTFAKQYVAFITIQNQAELAGYVVVDLRQRPRVSRDPAPMPDERFVKTPDNQEYSYALFEGDVQKFSSGPYNYERKFPSTVLLDSALYTTGLDLHGYRHVGQVGTHNRRIVVSTKSWGWNGFLANFSFLYLILVVVVALVIFGHALHSGISNLPLTYSTKIQILLNAAFIIPLLIVLFFILGIIDSHYRENQENAHIVNTRNLSVNIIGYMDDYRQGRMSQGYFEQQIKQIARDGDLVVNLYDTTGKILLASKPMLYQGGLVSELINPVAMKQIVEQKENQLLLNESLGDKPYNTAYVGLKSYDQKLLGVLSVPQFDAKSILDRQIIDIVASVLIVFTTMLIVFLLVSYLAANLLIEPLRVLARKISTTNLNQLNDPLPWHSNDEIGSVIKKYNQMLVNLDHNKQALSSNEKQSAWREMARQVAHEIKNPLTPMKLTLQQLQRTIRRDDPEALEKVNRAMESIIKQIDTIGYIAQSFSDIARMPPPKNELFEVTSVVNKAYELYSSDDTVTFRREITPGPLYVIGDRQQFGSSISNLIINARQSVPESRPAQVTVRLYTYNETIIVEVEDNGTGIPQNIRSRVFLPNFTTREGGTGLGLAMAKRIIEYAGGSIWFETEEGIGTTFFLSLPLVESP
ncbi:ATP-binding protein [Salmonirosea aquatica]|uniref:histidine kinase n=1 Tax=Salmonirosea aquatica TaxID=2654236 RepID=A0A7C9FYG8_9BACT|nr:HAMP domain-containing protein [Cytophagaceae bacterium SJW1-29]